MERQGWQVRRGLAALVVTALAAFAAPAGAQAASSLTPGASLGGLPNHGLGAAKPATIKRASSALSARLRAQAADLPASVDLTAYAQPPGDQGSVGSCAAWATDYTALGYWENKQGISGGGLAPMYTYSQLVHGQNVGTYIDDHPRIATSQGVDSQADYTQGNYDYTHLPTAQETANAANWKLTSYTDLAVGSTVTEDSIKAALAAGKPVVIGMPVYQNFFYVNSTNHGLYSGPSGPYEGGHAITALGYDSTGLRIENSWGAYWGDHGFATLSWSWVNNYVWQATAIGPLVQGNAAPVVSGTPPVTGTAQRAQTLTAGTGTWAGSPSSYAYQWQRDTTGKGIWGAVAGATDASYSPTSADVNARLRVQVTATNQYGSAQAYSAAVGPVKPAVPAAASVPVVSGDLVRAAKLTATTGAWNDSPTSYRYQWQRNSGSGWVAITGATSATYVLAPADVNASVRVLVSAVNAAGTGQATSDARGPVAAAPPVNGAAPRVTGTARRASVLTASAGTWNGPGNAYAFQWQRDAGSGYDDIAGAKAATYTLAVADENANVRVKVTATNPDGTVSAYSDPVGPVAAAPPTNTVAPSAAGTARRASVLSGNAGRWDGAGNVVALQWQRDTGSGYVDVAGAKATTYTLGLADETANVRLKVTVTNPDATVTAYSNAIGPVAAAPPVNIAAPTASGAARRGSVLVGNGGRWEGVGNSVALHWQRDTGSGYADIAGATGTSYTLGLTDEAASVRLKVTVTNPDATVTAYSNAIGPVAAAPAVNTVAPTISGAAKRAATLAANAGRWDGAGNTTTLQWQRDTGSGYVDITGAKASAYTLVGADETANVRLKVTVTNADGSLTAYSNVIGPIAAAPPVNTVAPVVSGTVRTGWTLTAGGGSWTPANPTLRYQWQRDSGSGFADIDGATTNRYTLTGADTTARVRVKVTATNEDGTASATSVQSAPVAAAR
jgi:Papain family cysteine protease